MARGAPAGYTPRMSESTVRSAPPVTTSVRVFYAMWPDAAAGQALHARAEEVAAQAGGRATPLHNLHLTLAFVGAVPEALLPRLATIGQSVARSAPPFPLTVDRLGAFRDAGIVWGGARQVPLSLQAIASALQDALIGQGVTIESRRFKAHITLARRCERAPAGGLIAPITWRVDAFTLTTSVLAPGGSKYIEAARFTLGGG